MSFEESTYFEVFRLQIQVAKKLIKKIVENREYV